MIITKLMGGLGNQMFQYASSYAIAKENGTELLLDDSWYREENSTVWRMKYELDLLSVTAKLTDRKDYKTTDDPKKAKDSMFGKNTYFLYKEDGLRYDPKVLKAGKNLVLDGYWQTEKYFAKYRDDILREFAFKKKLDSDLFKKITSTNAISLHVRRGDYASHAQTTSFHGLMGLDYYKKGVELIRKKNKDATLFVFSDEPDWCKENIKIDIPTEYVSGNPGDVDMQLMTYCNHHILANSSFSWWGAWLSTNAEKIVIAPKKWFNDPSADSTDIVPASWTRI